MSSKRARFQASISWGNGAGLSLGLYPKIKPPSSKLTTAPRPLFVSTAEMKGLLHKPKASLSHVWGLTVGTFALRFEDPAKQWRPVGDERWQFQGGDVHLDVVDRVYIDKDLVGADAPLGGELIGLIMTHELLHAQDHIDVFSEDAPRELEKDRVIRSLLIDGGQGEPGVVEKREYEHWVLDQTTDPDGNPCSYLTQRMIDLLVDALNAKAASRDSGPAYAEYGQNVSFLRQTGATRRPRR